MMKAKIDDVKQGSSSESSLNSLIQEKKCPKQEMIVVSKLTNRMYI